MRLVWQLIGTLLLVGVLIKYWWLVALVLAALVARADQQHAWALAGDERGTYGRYTPAA
jgi:hypothetical protein